jgi:hypothetical protein
MRPEQKSKSRAKLWDQVDGVKEIVGAGGEYAVGTIVFANIPLVTETVTIGGIWFGFKVGTAETVGTSAGTEADPHLCSVDTDLDAVGTSLAAQILLETATTGKWGYLYPDDSVGVDWTTDTLTLTFWPGVEGNAVTLAGSATDETIVQPVTASLGVAMPVISSDVALNILDTTGATTTQEYYYLADGDYIGQQAGIMITTFETSETPTVLGKFEELGVAMVLCKFITDEPGVRIDFIWTGSVWELTNYSAFATIPDFTAA